jgi:hypothetical protein
MSCMLQEYKSKHLPQTCSNTRIASVFDQNKLKNVGGLHNISNTQTTVTCPYLTFQGIMKMNNRELFVSSLNVHRDTLNHLISFIT